MWVVTVAQWLEYLSLNLKAAGSIPVCYNSHLSGLVVKCTTSLQTKILIEGLGKERICENTIYYVCLRNAGKD
jgi:hypothetical protein